MLFHPSVVEAAFERAEGKCEICGKVLEPCTDINDAPSHGWTVTQYTPGSSYTLENAYVVCLECHIAWFMKFRIQRKLSRKDHPKVLSAEEFEDVRAFYYRRKRPIQFSAEGWIYHWKHMKELKASKSQLHLRPLALLPPAERDVRIREEDELMHLAKKNTSKDDNQEDEEDE